MPTPVKLPTIVENVIVHTDSVKTILVRPERRCPSFKPGQFLHLAIDPYDPSFNWPESRVFSIANSPTRNEILKIIFAVKGAFTSRMFTEVRTGDRLFVKLPYGDFTFPETDRPVVLIAGGTGVTPFLSYLEYAVDKRLTNRITLHYGMRSPDQFICGPVLEECQRRLHSFNLYCYLEQGDGLGDFRVQGRGYIPLQEIISREPGPRCLYYLSGPPIMIVDFKRALLEEGIPGDDIKMDDWA
jgi:ferredoxin-NADP reductase